MVFRAMVFTFLPTVVELVLVCGILWTTFSPPVAGECCGVLPIKQEATHPYASYQPTEWRFVTLI
jgi:hypothetical protein